MLRLLLTFACVASALSLAGCTERERSGYSTIPQNSIPSWRARPYGDLHN
ncbi:MAG: hypothetical protein MJ016_04245 [Victivallaceae bacterium]|nr:hypothetical protein [Victivallaceae bacterium]